MRRAGPPVTVLTRWTSSGHPPRGRPRQWRRSPQSGKARALRTDIDSVRPLNSYNVSISPDAAADALDRKRVKASAKPSEFIRPGERASWHLGRVRHRFGRGAG
jgi:hypothetical protein